MKQGAKIHNVTILQTKGKLEKKKLELQKIQMLIIKKYAVAQAVQTSR